MKRIILIDGENLSYAIRRFLGTERSGGRVLADRDKLLEVDFRKLLNEVMDDNVKAEILFYGVRMKHYGVTKEISKKTKNSIARHSYLVNLLMKQGIAFVKVGNLRARETDPCEQCQHSKWVLVEKGVDVGLAVKMVAEAKPGVEIVLVSSDTDLLPAVKYAKSAGAKIVFVGYEYGLVSAIASQADITRLVTRQMVERAVQRPDKNKG
jgi:uncharacterized LabA/DUF88 family protein